MQIEPGQVVEGRKLNAVGGEVVAVPDEQRLVHLQFRRFAGCPICNLHLRSVVRRHGEIADAGISEVVVFHSGEDELLDAARDLPFPVIADPGKRLYAEFGVESAPRALLDPRVWWTIVRAVARSTIRIVRRQDRAPALMPTGGRFGLPGDFLIAPDGRVVAAHYGVHADDQWSVDDLLAHAGRARAGAGAG